MKFIIQQSHLKNALSIVGRSVSGNRIIPILEYIRFKIDKNDCLLYGNNLKECIIKQVQIDCASKTDIAIPYNDLSALVLNLPDQPLHFEIKDNNITIKSNTGLYEMVGENGADFPVPSDEVVSTTKIQAEDLNEGIFRSLFACSTDDLRPAFTGICMECVKSKITFMGTDANLASLFTIPCDVDLNNTFILPTNAAKIIQGLSLTGELSIKFTDNHLMVEQDGLTIYCTLLNEKYPPLHSVIPDNTFSLVVDRQMLIGSIKRVSKFAYQFVKLSLGVSVSVEGENLDFGKVAKEQLLAQYTGDDMIIGTDAEWLINCLNHCITEVVYLSFSKPNRAILIRETDSSEKENLMLCMPLMIAAK